jgi:hypothetical protein
VPLHPLDAVQLVVFVEFHASVEVPPAVTVEGVAVKVRVATGSGVGLHLLGSISGRINRPSRLACRSHKRFVNADDAASVINGLIRSMDVLRMISVLKIRKLSVA